MVGLYVHSLWLLYNKRVRALDLDMSPYDKFEQFSHIDAYLYLFVDS